MQLHAWQTVGHESLAVAILRLVSLSKISELFQFLFIYIYIRCFLTKRERMRLVSCFAWELNFRYKIWGVAPRKKVSVINLWVNTLILPIFLLGQVDRPFPTVPATSWSLNWLFLEAVLLPCLTRCCVTGCFSAFSFSTLFTDIFPVSIYSWLLFHRRPFTLFLFSIQCFLRLDF